MHGADSRASRLLAWLERPRAHYRLTALALLLASPALATGFVLDDHVLSVMTRPDSGLAGLHADPTSLFRFTTGRPEDNRALMNEGVLLPWWSDEGHRNAFLRPLSSLSHRLDFALFPDAAWLMHAHSLLWFAALLMLVAHVYRTLAPGPAVGAVPAFAVFALDDAHGMTATWIANRNALIAATLALPAVSAHHRLVTQGFRPGAYLGPACFALGLCAGETALAVLGYLFAHAVTLDRRPWPRRVLHLLPYLAITLLWRAVFSALGLGSAGSGAYHDPGSDPLGYAQALLVHLPVLIAAQVGLPLADTWFWGPPEAQAILLGVSVAGALAFAAVGHLLLRDDPEARFWMLGMIVSACAVAASVPGERLLLVPGVGGAAVVGKLLLRTHGALSDATQPRWHALVCAALVLLHLVLGPLLLPARALGMGVLRDASERVDRSLPEEPALRGATVVVLAAPVDVLVSYLQVGRQAQGRARPARLGWLATASSEITVEVLDEHSLRVRPARGYLLTSPEQHYRGDVRSLPVGARVALDAFTATVRSVTSDGRPLEVDFRFEEPLRSEALRFYRYEGGTLHPWPVPVAGARVSLPREDFFGTLLREALR